MKNIVPIIAIVGIIAYIIRISIILSADIIGFAPSIPTQINIAEAIIVTNAIANLIKNPDTAEYIPSRRAPVFNSSKSQMSAVKEPISGQHAANPIFIITGGNTPKTCAVGVNKNQLEIYPKIVTVAPEIKMVRLSKYPATRFTITTVIICVAGCNTAV